MPASDPPPHQTIDLSGVRCPNLLIATIGALGTIEPGAILEIIATDLNAPSSLSAWIRQSGHTLLGLEDEGARFLFLIRREASGHLPSPDGPRPTGSHGRSAPWT